MGGRQAGDAGADDHDMMPAGGGHSVNSIGGRVADALIWTPPHVARLRRVTNFTR
jgi:hypothetical protein